MNEHSAESQHESEGLELSHEEINAAIEAGNETHALIMQDINHNLQMLIQTAFRLGRFQEFRHWKRMGEEADGSTKH